MSGIVGMNGMSGMSGIVGMSGMGGMSGMSGMGGMSGMSGMGGMAEKRNKTHTQITQFLYHPLLFTKNDDGKFHSSEQCAPPSTKIHQLFGSGDVHYAKISAWFRRHVYQVYGKNLAVLHQNQDLYVFDLLLRDTPHQKTKTEETYNQYTIVCVLHSCGDRKVYRRGIQHMQTIKRVLADRYLFVPKILLLHCARKNLRKKWV
jgi:hypothetical protein